MSTEQQDKDEAQSITSEKLPASHFLDVIINNLKSYIKTMFDDAKCSVETIKDFVWTLESVTVTRGNLAPDSFESDNVPPELPVVPPLRAVRPIRTIIRNDYSGGSLLDTASNMMQGFLGQTGSQELSGYYSALDHLGDTKILTSDEKKEHKERLLKLINRKLAILDPIESIPEAPKEGGEHEVQQT